MKISCRSDKRAHYRVKVIVTNFFFLKKTSFPVALFIPRENSPQEQKRVNLGTNTPWFSLFEFVKFLPGLGFILFILSFSIKAVSFFLRGFLSTFPRMNGKS